MQLLLPGYRRCIKRICDIRHVRKVPRLIAVPHDREWLPGNVVECAKEAGIKKLVYAASSSCYGIPDEYPTKETAEIRPQYPYAKDRLNFFSIPNIHMINVQMRIAFLMRKVLRPAGRPIVNQN